MPFKKGTSGNPGGRSVGTLNKQRAIQERLMKIALDNIKQLEKDLLVCEPKDRIRFIIQILAMVLPKPLNEQEVEENCKAGDPDFYTKIHQMMVDNAYGNQDKSEKKSYQNLLNNS